MKNLKTMALVMAAMISICACGNAGARNDRKKASDSKAVVELNSETFQTKICDITKEDADFLGDKPAIVDFTATWCGPCQRLAPILEELAKEYKGKVDVYKVDVDKCRDLAEAFKISSIPAMLFIPKDGTPQMLIGLRDKATLKGEIDKILLGK
ncbi:MAG: thioredoxin [Bacteroidales bacterium]|nr:thioredoxin [Bacteroidales bacterium]